MSTFDGEIDWTLAPDTLKFLRGRIPKGGVGCFVCKWIVEDFEKNGKLTEWPMFGEKGLFPVKAKLAHIRLEKKGRRR